MEYGRMDNDERWKEINEANEDYWKEVGLELSRDIHRKIEEYRFKEYHTPPEVRICRAIKEDLLRRSDEKDQ